MRAARTRGWGSHGQAMGVDRITGGSGLRKGVFGGQSWGWRLSVVWLEQRTCVRERGGHRGAGVHALCRSRPTPEPSRWGHGEKVEEAGREAEGKTGEPWEHWPQVGAEDSGQRSWETTAGAETCPQGVWDAGKASRR